mgnify:CR=1 FL=1
MDDGVAPLAVVETHNPVSSAEHAKPGLLVGSEGGDVIGEDARLKRPEPGTLGLG